MSSIKNFSKSFQDGSQDTTI